MEATHSRPSPRSSSRIIGLSLAITVIGSFPVFLTGALAVQMRADLGFSVAALGFTAAVYRAVGATFAAPLGRLVDRIGPSASMRIAAALAVVVSLGIAVLTHRFAVLCMFLALSGVVNTLGQTGANLSLARGVRVGRQGLAFGLKQSALPIAALIAGVSVPFIALTVGWRWAFGMAALLATMVGLAVPSSKDVRLLATEGVQNQTQERRPLLVLALGLLFAMAAASTLGTFTVDSAVASGMSPASGGTLLAVGSVCAIVVRLVAGARADRSERGHLRTVAWIIGAGSVGFALMSLAHPTPMTLGILIAFGLGWGFNGLFWFAIVRLNQATPGRATGLVMTGGMIGGMLGPVVFGVIVELLDYPAAWLLASTWGLAGAGIMLWGARLVAAECSGRAMAPKG